MSACSEAINTRIGSKATYDTWTGLTQASLDSASPNIESLQKDIFNTANCLNEKISNLSTLGTADSNMQLQIEDIQKQIADEKKNLEIAGQRLASIKNNETSHYESWFPIERDIRPGSAAILLAISVALSFISLGYILQLMNVYIFVKYFGQTATGLDVSGILGQFTLSFWVVLIALISVVLYFVYK
jgi:hypothetical protein